jgi:hypothetical protein
LRWSASLTALSRLLLSLMSLCRSLYSGLSSIVACRLMVCCLVVCLECGKEMPIVVFARSRPHPVVLGYGIFQVAVSVVDTVDGAVGRIIGMRNGAAGRWTVHNTRALQPLQLL